MNLRKIKNAIKNLIIGFITGMAFGCIVMGTNILGTEGVSIDPIIMLTFGIVWITLFMIANCTTGKKK